MDARTDRNLLFGLLALQNGMIDQAALFVSFGTRARDKSRSLAEILVDQGAIDEADRAALAGMAARHLKRHGDDAEKSLAAVAVKPSTPPPARCSRRSPTPSCPSRSPSSGRRPTRTIPPGRPASPSAGQRFRILRPHARGGLGAVPVALDGELDREVALNEILDRHADDPASQARFLVEAEVTGGLEHPGIVPVYGLGRYLDGRPYYAMRFIRGDSLKEAIAEFHGDEGLKSDPGKRSLALRDLLRRSVDLGYAVGYAHGRGVLHRDLKPSNIIVGKHGETLVVGWGLAKAMGSSGSGPRSDERTLVPSSSSGSGETLPGSAIGTLSYTSPEQSPGDLGRLGPRSDVYSLGATLYSLLTGKAPFEGGNLGVLLRDVPKGAFPKPRQVDPAIPRALEAICLKAMANRPEDRYATARALADDLDRWAADEPVAAWREPAAILRQLLEASPTVMQYRLGLADNHGRLGAIRAGLGDAAGGIAESRRAITLSGLQPMTGEGLSNLACLQSLPAGVAARPGSGVAGDETEAIALAAVANLKRGPEAGYRDLARMRKDTDLDPLRPRPDFGLLMADLAFPVEPFAR